MWVSAPIGLKVAVCSCGCIHYFSYVCIKMETSLTLHSLSHPSTSLPNLPAICPYHHSADEYLPKQPRTSPCTIFVASSCLPAELFHPAAGLRWQVSLACGQKLISKPTTIYPCLRSKLAGSPGSALTHPVCILQGNVMVRLPYRLALSYPSEPSLMRAQPV